MTNKELDYIIQEGEGYLIEFKERVSASLARGITTLTDASGGRIFIGISDKGAITGITADNKTRSQIQDIANNSQPPVPVTVDFFENIAIVYVPEGKDKPYQCSDGFFIRMGPNSQKMTRDEIADFLQSEGKIRFEEQFHRTFDFAKHYLSYRGAVGENLKYLIRDVQDRPLACLLFGSAAWKTAPRDAFIGWRQKDREGNLRYLRVS